MDEGKEPLVFDVRSAGGRARNPWRIAGANVLDIDAMDALDAGLRELGRDREIVLYCT
jgi:rhodanese-related sulfurtransferase